MTAYLTAEEVIELASYIVSIEPDDLEQAKAQLEDLTDLFSGYLGPAGDLEVEPTD